MRRKGKAIEWSEQWRLRTEAFAAQTTNFIESLERTSFPQRVSYVQGLERQLACLRVALAKHDPASIMECVRKIEMAVCIVQYWGAICKGIENHAGEEDKDAREEK